MWIIWAIIVGLIVGAVAKLIMPGRDPGGIIVTVLLGIGGSVLATWIGQAVGWYGPGQGAGFIASIIGAIIILAIYRAVAGRPAA
ncbi:MAG: GlsB/YeaQ/YmgE family stress response membrane protein [Acetobacteraceae bacterium]|nr:GlsB/YeaQ/YmgE family stress response membrane protein [Acetobacteraceae bacterium]